MIFQNPRAALNPIRKVGHQLEDVLLHHGRATRASARRRVIEALEAVRIRDAEARYDAYPSGFRAGCASAPSSPSRSPVGRG
jgi:peptide/nickel transport system ATP-binding protein